MCCSSDEIVDSEYFDFINIIQYYKCSFQSWCSNITTDTLWVTFLLTLFSSFQISIGTTSIPHFTQSCEFGVGTLDKIYGQACCCWYSNCGKNCVYLIQYILSNVCLRWTSLFFQNLGNVSFHNHYLEK